MKTKFLASTAIVLIGLSGAAWAQQSTPVAKPESAAATAGAETPIVGEDAGAPAADVATDAPIVDEGEVDHALPGSDAPSDVTTSPSAAEPAADMATETSSDRLRSYSSSTASEPFTGSVAGGMSADDLIGMNVVDSDGENVGKVSDLIIGQDDVVNHAIVEVGGFLGFGAKTTAIALEHATFDESKGEVTLDISRAEIDAMPAYQQDNDGWFAG